MLFFPVLLFCLIISLVSYTHPPLLVFYHLLMNLEQQHQRQNQPISTDMK